MLSAREVAEDALDDIPVSAAGIFRETGDNQDGVGETSEEAESLVVSIIVSPHPTWHHNTPPSRLAIMGTGGYVALKGSIMVSQTLIAS